MTDQFPTRRSLLIGLGFASIDALNPLRAQGVVEASGVTWDRAKSEALWSNAAGPAFTILDTFSLEVDGKTHPAPNNRLTTKQVADVTASLVAASKFYRSKGMGAPNLPILGNRFAVFFISKMGEVNGASGPAKPVSAGLIDSIFGPSLPQEGYYLMVNADSYFSPDDVHPWAPRTTLAHELLHCIDDRMVGSPGWRPRIGKWWSEGQTEATGQHAYKEIGYDPLTVLKGGGRLHAQNVGMRPYDQSLTLKLVPNYRPKWVRNGAAIVDGEADAAKSFYSRNATYFTCSFWRYLLKEIAPVVKPPVYAAGYFELMPALRRYVPTDADVKIAAGNPYMDSGIPVLDRFLRKEHPVWKGIGLYRAFPAFIAHFVEWPDQIVKSRAGLFAHSKWLDVLFTEHLYKQELSAQKSIDIEIEILPIAASAIQFSIPADGFLYPPITIGIQVIHTNGQSDAIQNVHVGLRGQCLANSKAQVTGRGSSRIRRWSNIKATPLNRKPTAGETVLTLINVAPDPTSTRPIKVRLTIALQVVSSYGQCSYHPQPVVTPTGKKISLPSSTAPAALETVPTLAILKGVTQTKIVIMKDADVTRMITAMADSNTQMAMERLTDDPQGKPDTVALTAAMSARMTSGQMRPLNVELTLPYVAADYLGAVKDAHVAVEWTEPRYAKFAEYDISQGIRIETDSVQVQITGSTESSLLGTFSADFDKGTGNDERIFRGQINGKFSVGIIADETQDDEQSPQDPVTMMPTDFFVGIARAGADVAKIIETMRSDLSDKANSTDGKSGRSGGNTTSAGGGVTDPIVPKCVVEIMPSDFEKFFVERVKNLPGINASQIAEIRASLLADPEAANFLVCAWKQEQM